MNEYIIQIEKEMDELRRVYDEMDAERDPDKIKMWAQSLENVRNRTIEALEYVKLGPYG